MPGRDRQLLGGDAVDAALDEQLAEPVLHAPPVALHLLLGLDLLAPQAVADRRRLGAELGARATPTGCAPGRWRARASAGPRAAQRARRGGGDRGLADAALARVEDRARRHERRVYGGCASRRSDVRRVALPAGRARRCRVAPGAAGAPDVCCRGGTPRRARRPRGGRDRHRRLSTAEAQRVGRPARRFAGRRVSRRGRGEACWRSCSTDVAAPRSHRSRRKSRSSTW